VGGRREVGQVEPPHLGVVTVSAHRVGGLLGSLLVFMPRDPDIEAVDG
jgi:hypothetical protein